MRVQLIGKEGETDMKENIRDKMVRGVLLAALLWFGFRGVLPEVIAGGDLYVLILAGIAAIAGFAFGPYVYEAYRCSSRCDPTCHPKFCRTQ
jgi:purine-cytosine permease-like protein